MGEPEVIGPPGAALRRAVFLDRDGVLNRAFVRDGKPYPPDRLEEFELLPGVPEGCDLLKAAGFLLVVATNQPDVGRGRQSRATVEEMHRRLRGLLPLDDVRVCYDGGSEPSDFSKPAPGMLLSAAREWGIDLGRSYMIGDRWRDVDCGRAAGCATIFVEHGYCESLRQQPDFTVGSLLEAAKLIVEAITDKA
jgi:D-glycero-D-manno-heptose 1,7-bisphosphate phosphatase